MSLSSQEEALGRLAASKVCAFGGRVTFAEYDAIMRAELYFSPISWIAGWGDHSVWKANNDKLCAFAAVKMGLLKKTASGYQIV